MLKNVRHTGIITLHPEKQLTFYQKCLGMKLVMKKTLTGQFVETLLNLQGIELTYYKLAIGNTRWLIELWHITKPVINHLPSTAHIAFTVKDLDKLYKQLIKYSVEIVSTPMIDEAGRNKLMFCKDYEGNLVELVEEL